MRRTHDMGGLAAGPIDTREHEYEPWEKRVKVMVQLLSRQDPPVMTLDEHRRAVEDLGEEEYNRLRYYQRWTAAISNVLLQKGIISVDQLGRKMKEVDARWRREREG